MESIVTVSTTLSLPSHAGTITDLAWSPDGKKLAAVTDRGFLHVWYTGTGTRLTSLRLGQRRLLTVAWAHGGRALTVGGEHGALYRLSRLTNPVVTSYAFLASTPITQIVWSQSPVGRCLLVSGETLTVLDARGQSPTTVHYTQPILDVDWGADGRTLAVVCRDGLVDIWDAELCQSRSLLDIAGAQCLCWHRDADRLAVGTITGQVHVRRPYAAHQNEPPLQAPFPLQRMQWGERYLVAGDGEGSLALWSAREGTQPAHHLAILAPTFVLDPGGTRLATATRESRQVTLAKL